MQSTRATIHLYLFFTGIVIVMVGFMFSRYVLGIGIITLISNGFIQSDWKERATAFLQNKIVLGISCLFLLPFISGLWSVDTATWLNRMQDKLPLLLLPFALVMQKGFERKQFVFFSLLWIALLFGGTLWSSIQYLQQQDVYHELYRSSKVIPTWAGNDHIRFSMAIIIGMLLWLKMEEWKIFGSAVGLWVMRIIMCWFVLFLHILSAKTGLLGLYVIVLPCLIWQLSVLGKRKLIIATLVLAASLPVLAYQLLPTFKTRVHYILYDRTNWQQANFNGTFSDGNRWLSIQSGWHVFRNNWLTGVGYGDIETETAKWYDAYAPAVTVERYLPLNQWVTSGSGAGILALLVFTAVILLPFFSKEWRSNKPAIAFVLFFNCIFLFETTIDDQLGVFLYCFFTLYWHLSHRLKP